MGTLVDVAYALKKRIYERRRQDSPRADARRVIIRMDAGIGNAVEATPVVQAVRAFWPAVRIAIVVPRGDLFDDWCVADEVLHPGADLGKADEVFVCWSCEHEGGGGGEIHRAQGLFPLWQLRPEREVNMAMVRRLGYPGATPPLYVGLREPKEPLPPSPLRIALCAGGKPDHRWRNKRWPYYRELARLLREWRPDAQIVLLDGDLDGIAGLDLRGRLTLREAAWVLKHCQLAIGNDSGPMHIADAVLTPHLTLFGPTCEVKNGPRNRGAALRTDVPCSPCQYDLELLDSCADPLCMKGLAASTVMERVIATVSSSASPGSAPRST